MNALQKRKLAAILFADIVGYTALMQTDEPRAVSFLQKFKTELESKVSQHQGEIIQFYGDGCLATFNSSVDAVTCAEELQLAFHEDPSLPVRIGLHSGDVVYKDGNVFGDAVNVASRIESMGIPGAVLLSSNVRNQIKNQPGFELKSLGRFEFKNVKDGMTVYVLVNKGLSVPKSGEIKRKHKEPVRRSRNWISTVVGIIAVSIAGYFFYQNQKELIPQNNSTISLVNPNPSKKPSIALLQLEDGSLDKSLAYLGFGLKEELLTALIKLQKLDIISANQIKVAQSKEKDPQLIGEQLKADYVLGGSARAYDNTIRFNVRLLDVATKQFVWAYNEESPQSEMLQLQQNFAEAIALNMPIQFTEEDLMDIKKSDVDPNAYNMYLKGAYGANYIPEAAQNSSQYLLEAISIDPDFSMPYEHLAENEWVLAHFGTEPPIPHWIKAQQYIDKAILLDSLNPAAWGTKGIIQHNYEWDYLSAERSFKKAIEIGAEERARDLAWFLSINGRKEELISLIDPYVDKAEFQIPLIADMFLAVGELDRAQRIISNFSAGMVQNDWYANQVIAHLSFYEKDYNNAISAFKKSVELSQSNLESLRMLGFVYGKNNQPEQAKEILDQFSKMKESRYVAPFHFATVYFGLEDFENGFKELNKSYEEHDFHMRWIWRDMAFRDAKVQNDPRYRDLLNKMKLGHLPPRMTTEQVY